LESSSKGKDNRSEAASPSRKDTTQQKKSDPSVNQKLDPNVTTCSKFITSDEAKTESSSTKKDLCRKDPSPSRKSSLLNCASRKECSSPVAKENDCESKIKVAVSSKADVSPSRNPTTAKTTVSISSSKALRELEASKFSDKKTPAKISFGHKDEPLVISKTTSSKLTGSGPVEDLRQFGKISTSENGMTATVTPYQSKLNTTENKEGKTSVSKPSVVTCTTSVKFVKNSATHPDNPAPRVDVDKEQTPPDTIPEVIEMVKASEHFAKKDISRQEPLSANIKRSSPVHECNKLNETQGSNEVASKPSKLNSPSHNNDQDKSRKSESSTSSDTEESDIAKDDCSGLTTLTSIIEINDTSPVLQEEENPRVVVANLIASVKATFSGTSSSSTSSDSSDNLPSKTNDQKLTVKPSGHTDPKLDVLVSERNTGSKNSSEVREARSSIETSHVNDEKVKLEVETAKDKGPIIVSFSSVTSESDSSTDSNGGKLPPLADDHSAKPDGNTDIVANKATTSSHSHSSPKIIQKQNDKTNVSDETFGNSEDHHKNASDTPASEEIVMLALDDALAMLTSVVLETNGKTTASMPVTPIKVSPKLEGPTVPPRTSVTRAYSHWAGAEEQSPSSVRRDTSTTKPSNPIQYEESRRLEQKIVEINKKYGLIGENSKDDALKKESHPTATKVSNVSSRNATESGVKNSNEADEPESRRKPVAKQDSFNRADSPLFREPLPLPKESVIRRYREKARDSSSSSSSRSRDTSPRTSSPHAGQRNARARQRRKEAEHSHSKSHSIRAGHQQGHLSHLSTSNERLHASRPVELDLHDTAHRRARRSKTTAAVPHRRRKHDWPSLDPSTAPLRSPDWQGPGTIGHKDSSETRLTSAELSYTSPASEWTAISNRVGTRSSWKHSPLTGHGSAAVVQRIIERSAGVGGTDCRTSAHQTSTNRSSKMGGSKIGKT